MDILDKLEKVKTSLEAEEKKKMRFQGKLDAKMESLNDLGYSTITKAKASIKKLNKKLDDLSISLEEKINDFEDEFPHLIGDE